jgi:hypothetical protein
MFSSILLLYSSKVHKITHDEEVVLSFMSVRQNESFSKLITYID